MPCPIQVEDVFGPVVAPVCHDGFDLTLLFEQLFLCIAPAALVALLIPFRLWQLSRRRREFSPGPLYRAKLATHSALFAVHLAQLVLLCVPHLVPRTRASIPAAAVVLFTTLLCIALSHLDHLRSVRPSALLSLYLGLTVLFDLVQARTLWAVDGNLPGAVAFSVGLGFKLACFVLESREKISRHTRPAHGPDQSRETTGSVFTRGLLWWLNPLFWRGFRHVLSVECLPVIDAELGAPELYHQLWSKWSRCSQMTANALTKLLIVTHRQSILDGVLPRLALSGFTFAQPFLITRVIKFASTQDDLDTRLDAQIGDALIAATAIIYIGLAVSNAQAQHKAFRVITKLRASLISLIYYKLLGLSIPTVQESSAITLMSTDVERTGPGLRFMHEVWASPVDLGLGFYLLQRELGPAAAAPGVLFLLCSAAGLKVAASMSQRQRLWLEAIQRRIEATSDTLSSIKEVRMGGLQARMEAELEDLRKAEIAHSRPFKNALALIVCLSYTTAALGPVISFGIFSLLAKRNSTEPLTADRGFTALAVFSLLRTPMATILDSLAGLVGSLGAVHRVGEYLSVESHRRAFLRHPPLFLPSLYHLPTLDKDDEAKDVVTLLAGPQEKTTARSAWQDSCVVATQYCAGWDRDRGYILRDLSLSIKTGSLTFIVGPVGCGKSTLLLSILGETTMHSGSIQRSFDRAAYVGQSAWLISDTIQNNIIGTSMLDQSWYDQVIDACALRDDISHMPCGDQEMVDGGGSNLSGGQQARLGIARAIYSRQQLVLLDDIMSGLDARTEQTLFHNLLGPNGLLRSGKVTTVFATNALHRLSAGDHVIVLSHDGKIAEQGAYDQLQSIVKHSQAAKNVESEHVGAALLLNKPTTNIQELGSGLTAPKVTGSKRRTGDFTIYKYYAHAAGWFNCIIFVSCGAIFVFALIFPQYLMNWWTQENARHAHGKLGLYLGSYLGLACFAIFGLAAGCLQLVSRIMPRVSAFFHTTLLRTTLDAPLSLLAGSVVGETLNRFSQDLLLIDMELPLALFNTTIELLSSFANLVVIAIAAGYIGAALPVVLVVFFLVQTFYLRTARQLRLLEIEAKAPLVSHFLETCTGLAAIRAYGAAENYEERCMEKIAYAQKPKYLLFSVQRWLNLVLDLIVAVIAIVFITIAIKLKGHIDSSLVGTALVGIVNFSVSIKALLENWTNLEMCVGAVSRVRDFALETTSEHHPGEDREPPPDWPSHGQIAYQNVTAAWEGKNLQPVIKEVSLVIEPGQKIAICGRTGSGKSSLVSALFRLLQPQSGRILVDGVDIAAVSCQTLRERLICVPQVPFLSNGTVRDNVDPFNIATDKDILDALCRVQMQDAIKSLGGLDAVIENDSMSIGQKQLLCLARATLRPGSILILDEATASLDWDTDRIVQEVIRSAFEHHTVIAIVHRLWNVTDYDRVAVIANGRLAEYGPPKTLLLSPDSLFSQLYRIGADHDGQKREANGLSDEEGQGERD